MPELFRALAEPHMAFLRYALAVGLLASVAFGIVGTYVVTRRITYIAAAIAHCVLGGIGLGLFLREVHGLTWCSPMLGAVAAALVSAVVIGLVSLYAGEREDTVIGAVWSIGMASGLLLMQSTPGYRGEMNYLFGDILWVGARDLWMVLVLDLVVVGLAVALHNKLVAVCFDDEFAALRGVHVKRYYVLLLCLVALSIVLLVRVVGIIMVIALVTLPAAVAGHFTRRLGTMMLVAAACCMAVVASGLAISFQTDLRSGPVIVLVAGAAYLAVVFGKRCREPLWWIRSPARRPEPPAAEHLHGRSS